ncbi:MAG: phosphopentomutase [Verrucomicrobia bacterium GWF2_62_7]|nr:MAG: phosphopentomutase [Verrucomicrobia bacterium GWF2_62_7]
MADFKRGIIIVMDSVGIGALPDAAAYGDTGADTLGGIARGVGQLDLPNFAALGLGRVKPLPGLEAREVCGSYGRMDERSPNKDTTAGHWEMAGLTLDYHLPTYPQGFPREVLDPFEQKIGRGVLANKPSSGTTIIEELGDEHVKTGKPIVYTSADSVFQIAAHEDVVPLSTLYQWCQWAREILVGQHAVSRVIARPFTGKSGSYKRTANRHDYAFPPPGKTLLDHVKDAGLASVGVGKISDIFCGQGITRSLPTKGNNAGLKATVEELKKHEPGLLFVNLVDFDMLYGHRRNIRGYYESLVEMDRALPEILGQVADDELLIITADHGNDPSFPGSDHTREYVPLLVYGPRLRNGVDLGTRKTFADIAKTLDAALGLGKVAEGGSFLDALR